MESDDDYESFSFLNNEPSPSPKLRKLKRLRKTAIELNQSETIESVSELLGLPKVDFAKLEALESAGIKAFDHDSSPRSLELEDCFDNGDGDSRKEKELSSCFVDIDDQRVDIDRKDSKIDLEFEEGFDADDDENDDSTRKEKELKLCFDDIERKESETDLEFEVEEGFDDVIEKKLRTDRKETKRALEFDDDNNENLDATHVEIRDDEVNEVDEHVVNEKKRKKKRDKSSSENLKMKSSVSNIKREAKVYLFLCLSMFFWYTLFVFQAIYQLI